MTTAQMGDAIADACQWTRDHTPESDFLYRTADGRGMFNPAACLNAMHEAEKVLTPKLVTEYNHQLFHLPWPDTDTGFADEMIWHATARQRAEAFLRTIGKWRD